MSRIYFFQVAIAGKNENIKLRSLAERTLVECHLAKSQLVECHLAKSQLFSSPHLQSSQLSETLFIRRTKGNFTDSAK